MDYCKWYVENVEPYRPTVYKFLLKRTRSPETAEDLTQDTLLRIYTYIQLYPEEKVLSLALPGWLFEVARTTHLNAIRRHSLQVEPIESLEGKESDALGASDGKEGKRSEEPEAAYELKEFRNQVEGIVSGLPDRFRKVLMLCLFRELKSTEIAKELNRPVNTVRADLSYGRKMLRERLEEDTGQRSAER